MGVGARPTARRNGTTLPHLRALCSHIEARETGEGAFCPLPVCPSPRGDTSHGPVYGENLKRELAQGFTLPDTAFLGYRHDCPRPSGRGRRPEAGWGGGCQRIEPRDRGGDFLPPAPRGEGGGRRPGGAGDVGALKPERQGGWSSGFSGATPPGVGDAGALKPERQGRGFCPRPPWRCPHGPV